MDWLLRLVPGEKFNVGISLKKCKIGVLSDCSGIFSHWTGVRAWREIRRVRNALAINANGARIVASHRDRKRTRTRSERSEMGILYGCYGCWGP